MNGSCEYIEQEVANSW